MVAPSKAKAVDIKFQNWLPTSVLNKYRLKKHSVYFR